MDDLDADGIDDTTNTALIYLPYPQSTINEAGWILEDHGVEVRRYASPWTYLEDQELRRQYSEAFGNLWTVPADGRLHLILTYPGLAYADEGAANIMANFQKYQLLASTHRRFVVMDFDADFRCVEYEFGRQPTAAEAEIFHVEIGPVGPFLEPSSLKLRESIELPVSASVVKSTRWRRLM